MGFTQKNVIRIAIIVGTLLLIPLVLTIRDGGVEGVGWNWSPADFFVMGGLLFAVGPIIDLASRKITRPLPKALAILAIIFAFLALWAELAVDAVSTLLSYVLD